MSNTPDLARIPSVDRLLRAAGTNGLLAQFGRPLVTEAIRAVLAELRGALGSGADSSDMAESSIFERISSWLADRSARSLRPVFNLTGTVLHTNLGRAPLPSEAVAAVAEVSLGTSNLEYDLASGERGDRDDHLEDRLCRLTGAAAATVVNNNAAAVLLVLNSLARRREVPTSRGELIEIGGSFRLPDIMASSGCRLREVGTTNRTHLRDFEDAIGAKTGLVMKVHTSNYEIQGFTAAVGEAELARLCHDRGVPFAVDLGSGTLLDLSRFGLPREPTPGEAIANGADVVTFSGDKLLGGPQAGIIVGRADLIAKIKRNPLKRALRVGKMTTAALEAVLRLYEDPDRLAEKLPGLRMLTRPVEEIRKLAERLRPDVALALQGIASVALAECQSQVGSGALPSSRIDSAGLVIRPAGAKSSGTALKRIAAAFRALPVPVIGRVQQDGFWLDLRCLEDESGFREQLVKLGLSPRK